MTATFYFQNKKRAFYSTGSHFLFVNFDWFEYNSYNKLALFFLKNHVPPNGAVTEQKLGTHEIVYGKWWEMIVEKALNVWPMNCHKVPSLSIS